MRDILTSRALLKTKRLCAKHATYLGVHDKASEPYSEPFVKVVSCLAWNFLWNLDELNDGSERERFFSCPLQAILFL